MWEYNHNELYHFGVLGMKWGASRSREVQSFKKENKGARGSGEYKEGMKTAKSKAANRLYSTQSKALNDRVVNQSFKKAFSKSLLMGSYGALKYEKSRVDGGQKRGVAAAVGVISNIGNKAVANLPSTYEYGKNLIARDYKVFKKAKEYINQ